MQIFFIQTMPPDPFESFQMFFFSVAMSVHIPLICPGVYIKQNRVMILIELYLEVGDGIHPELVTNLT